MEKLKLKHAQLLDILDRLEESSNLFENFEKYSDASDPDEKEKIYRAFRDSLIQRFELSVDLFWKYVKRYLQKKVKQAIEINAPRPVIRDACRAKLISEEDAEDILTMIDDRNMSSHIYKEEIAEQISSRIINHYQIIKKCADRLSP